MNQAYLVLANAFSKGHCKATVASFFMIYSDTIGIGGSKCERLHAFCGVYSSKSVLGDCTIIDFECDIVRFVLIIEIHLAKL